MIETAFINLWNKRVGAVYWNRDSQIGSFEFEPSFLNQGWNISPFKMPINGASGKIFSFPELRSTGTFKGMPGLLADVMLDKYGNALINAWLAQNGRQQNSLNPVEVLCFIGKRGMGALEFEPVEPKITGSSTRIEMDNLINIAQGILSGRQDFHTNISEDKRKALFEILKIGTSAGGARAKAVIAYNTENGEVRSGQAAAPKGFEHWLIKLDGVRDDQIGVGSGPFGLSGGYGRVEMAYHKMASDCGIEMTECRLLEENGRAHFMTRRFDRTGGKEKLHVQSFCGIQHYDFSEINSYGYEQLFQTMRMLRLPYTEAEQMFKRMVFNVLARNCDDHTKNFSFVMDMNGKWKLSPAYDVCYSYRPDSKWVSQQTLSVNGKRQGITDTDFMEVAKNMNIKNPEATIENIKKTIGKWNGYAEKQKVPDNLANEIKTTLLV